MDPDHVMQVFREATWDEALDFAGGALAKIRDTHGKKSLAGFGSAKRQQRGNLPLSEIGAPPARQQQRRSLHAAVSRVERWPHCSEGIGSGPSATPSWMDQGGVVILIGANPTVNHPVADNSPDAMRTHHKLCVMDPGAANARGPHDSRWGSRRSE